MMIEQIEWIAYAEQVPPDGEDVLVFGAGGSVFPAVFDDCDQQPYPHFRTWDDEEIDWEVTHWAIYPSGPKA